MVLPRASRSNSRSCQATPGLCVTAPSGPWTGTPFVATASVTGVDGSQAASLEGVSPERDVLRRLEPLTFRRWRPADGPRQLHGGGVVPGSTDYASARKQPGDVHHHPGHAAGERDGRRRGITRGRP